MEDKNNQTSSIPGSNISRTSGINGEVPDPATSQAYNNQNPSITSTGIADTGTTNNVVNGAPLPMQIASKGLPLILKLILATSLLAIVGLVTCWFLFWGPNAPLRDSPPTNGESAINDQPRIIDDSNEKTITDSEIISTLYDKMFLLHIPEKNHDYVYPYKQNEFFGFGDGRFPDAQPHNSEYKPLEKYYRDVNSLDGRDKTTTITRYLKDSGAATTAKQYGLTEEFYHEKGYSHCGVACDPERKHVIPESVVTENYTALFADEPVYDDTVVYCGMAYDAKLHIFYDIPSSDDCRALDSLLHEAYIIKYTENEENAFVYLSINTIKMMSNGDKDGDEGHLIYKTFLTRTEILDPETHELLPDESLIYGRTNNENRTKKKETSTSDSGSSSSSDVSGESTETAPYIEINADNYQEFEQYRFVFKKTEDGNYQFVTVEKTQ